MRASNILLSKICYKNIVNNIYCSKYMVYISVFFNVIIKKKTYYTCTIHVLFFSSFPYFYAKFFEHIFLKISNNTAIYLLYQTHIVFY